jgi:hypothetical protein
MMEELKEVLGLISELGGDAKQAFIWWLVMKMGKYALHYGVVLTLIFTLAGKGTGT